MRHARLASLFGVAALIGACGTRHPDLEVFAPPTAAYDAVPADVVSLAAGTWGGAEADAACAANAHTISFDEDRRQMLLTFREPVDGVAPDTVVRYRILAAVHRGAAALPVVIRAAEQPAARGNEDGEPRVWDLVLASRNRYLWRSTGAHAPDVTRSFVRCDELQGPKSSPQPD